MLRIIFYLSAVLISTNAIASNYNFLKDAAPIADFKKDDVEILQQTIQDALNNMKDGEKLAWSNDKTGNAGLVNPVLTLDSNEGECRQVRIVNRSKQNIAESMFKFCKLNGKWIAIEMLKK